MTKQFTLPALAGIILLMPASFAGGDGFDCKKFQQGQCQPGNAQANWTGSKPNGIWEQKSNSGQMNSAEQKPWNTNCGSNWGSNSPCEQKQNWEQKSNFGQNCPEKQSQWGQPGGSYPMKDGGQLTVDQDGTKHFRSPDGSEKIMRPDGSGIWKRADGASMERTADGRKIYRSPDGHETVMEQPHKN